MSLIFTLSGCATEDPLVGQWQRIEPGSSYNNLIVNVERLDGGSYRALIVNLGDRMSAYNYKVGDTKWKDVTKLSDGLYEYNDLGKQSNKVVWHEMYLNYDKSNPDEITMTSVASNGQVGSSQLWHRVKSE